MKRNNISPQIKVFWSTSINSTVMACTQYFGWSIKLSIRVKLNVHTIKWSPNELVKENDYFWLVSHDDWIMWFHLTTVVTLAASTHVCQINYFILKIFISFLKIQFFFFTNFCQFLKKIFFLENFNISENNIINVQSCRQGNPSRFHTIGFFHFMTEDGEIINTVYWMWKTLVEATKVGVMGVDENEVLLYCKINLCISALVH